MGSGWRARSQRRAREFGARYPRLAVIIACAVLAGLTAICGLQLGYGTYLGRGWVIAALAGMATAGGVTASALISLRRHGGEMGLAVLTWLVLVLVSASSIRFPFPRGPYGGVQAFFNVVHAALLGYEAVTLAAVVALLGYALISFRDRAGSQAVRALPAPGHAGPAADRAGLPARLRFPGTTPAAWRAGRLVAADGTVRWRSRKGDTEVDLTAACQDPAMLSAGAQARQRAGRSRCHPPGAGPPPAELNLSVSLNGRWLRRHRPSAPSATPGSPSARSSGRMRVSFPEMSAGPVSIEYKIE